MTICFHFEMADEISCEIAQRKFLLGGLVGKAFARPTEYPGSIIDMGTV